MSSLVQERNFFSVCFYQNELYFCVWLGVGKGAFEGTQNNEVEVPDRREQFLSCLYVYFLEDLWWTCYIMAVIGKVRFIQASLEKCEGHIETFFLVNSYCQYYGSDSQLQIFDRYFKNHCCNTGMCQAYYRLLHLILV